MSHVEPDPIDDVIQNWENEGFDCSDAWAKLAKLREDAEKGNALDDLVAACEATLLFYAVDWTDERKREWESLTGGKEATTKSLCDCARAALAAAKYATARNDPDVQPGDDTGDRPTGDD